jgi:hypothetical protein
MFKSMRTLLVLAVVAMLTAVGVAQAEVITNAQTSIAYSGFVPCANGGAGELLTGTIDVHERARRVNEELTGHRFSSIPFGSEGVRSLSTRRSRPTRRPRGASCSSTHRFRTVSRDIGIVTVEGARA